MYSFLREYVVTQTYIHTYIEIGLEMKSAELIARAHQVG